MTKERTHYIDNIRVYLTMLVIFHHAAVAYGGPGSWYYSEPNESRLSVILLTLLVATNQAFFMGFFFFLSSYFIPSSLSRKGSTAFLIDRIKRLGIPLIFYSLVIGPVTIYIVLKFAEGATYSFMDYYLNRSNWIEFGVLWFTAALLLFTTCYWFIKKINLHIKGSGLPLPSNRTIFLFSLVLGIVSFFVRIVFPVGWTLKPFGFQLGHFTQYIALFITGIVAYKNDWLQHITFEKGIQWLRVSLILLLIGFPFMYLFKEITHSSLDDFQGGIKWSSLISCIWEQTMGISLVMTFLGIGKQKWNNESPLLKTMARSAYAVYIIHPLVLVSVSLLIMDASLTAGLKFAVAGSISVVVSFLIGWGLVKVPVVNNIV